MNRTRNTTQLSLAALAVATAFAPAASAQEQKLTEVVITANRIVADRASVAGFGEQALLQTPASVSVLTREQLQDLNIRNTTDAVKFDASIGDAYNAVGYAEQFSIRGFKLDNASSYRKDGHAISGDTQIPLENKESIEVLRGLAGLQMGVAAPGGIINYVTKRPTESNLRSVLLEVSERGTVLGTVDLGGRFEDRRFGYRINAAGERLRSIVKGADGRRSFFSAAFDWRISPQALLTVDADYQKKSQLTAPGFQLTGGTRLPVVDADLFLNDQPWAKPVMTETSNIGIAFQYQLAPEWKATLSANQHRFKRDDYTAFPYGCSSEELWPGYCSNGDYDVYDYRSLGEEKKPTSAKAHLQGKFATGSIKHELTAGLSVFSNHERWGDYVYDKAGVSNIFKPVVVPLSSGVLGPVSERRADNERAAYVQDIIGLNEQLALHTGARFVSVRRTQAKAAATSDNFWLPNVALVYSPSNKLSYYASYAQGLQHGGVAPIETTNKQTALAPGKSKQVELGAKTEVNGVSLSAAVYQIEQGLEFTNPANTFVRQGVDRHRGLEFSAQGKLSRELLLGASMAAIDTEQDGTGLAIFDGKRVTNVPNFKSTVWADYVVSAVPGLKLTANWQHAGRKAFDQENKVMVPSYHVVNLGGSYAYRVGGASVIVRAQVKNAFDKFYWRDVTPDVGGYLFPGAPRTFQLSAQVDF
ncbi:TonB-dependent siderophore receptor [Pseudoduganella sp. DS3]|uniref:TonB-dependent siderophore receptor n=1 Tax=Pseudoduganella guangdongensis TaxID=2692179 RepID=A0A6N9HI91_9BURK|nr:TonB-dependent siderophore receptor [Pseudoduganella guangdongensis]MYN02997.1 TonB-dependent siderophore receptor [Pseudoduganella guangdongensis]